MSDSKEDGVGEYLSRTNDVTPMEIKEEINIEIKLEEDVSEPTDNPFQNIQVEVKEEVTCDQEVNKNDKDSEINNHEKYIEVKKESQDIISYDYPNFEDSMDSEDATALGNVETCLQEDVKEENYLFEVC